MRQYRPSRKEIDAAHKAYSILFAPLPKEKEITMPKIDKTQTATTGQELATREAAPLARDTEHEGTGGGHELALLDPDVLRQLNDAVRELELGFSHVAPKKVYERAGVGVQKSEAFTIIDAIATEIPSDDRSEMKPVFVFALQMESGDVLTMMQGYNSVRAKWAQPFMLARAAGMSATAGPLKIGTRPAKINDAFTFEVQKGFRVQVFDGQTTRTAIPATI